MNNAVLKYLIISGLLVGAILGIIAGVPYIGGIALFSTLFLCAPVVMVLLIMAGKFDLTTTKDSIVGGAAVGFCANIAFSFSYSIVNAILFLTIKYTTNYVLTAIIMNSPIWLLILIVFFIGVLTATTNAFSGFVTYYVINLIRDLYEKKHYE
jgi:hypothetical protein